MDEKLKKKWVEALRSGEYKQVSESLKGEVWDEENEKPVGVGYCCLGVLCEIHPDIKWNGGRYIIKGKELAGLFADLTSEDNDGWDAFDWQKCDDDLDGAFRPVIKEGIQITGEELPTPLVVHLGMNKTVRYDKKKVNVHSKLISMNDRGKSFEQIADYIERVL